MSYLAVLSSWFAGLKVSDWLGLYGAAVSTALAISKGISYYAGPRSAVRLRLRLGRVPAGPMFLVRIVNRSGHSVCVDALEVAITGFRERMWVQTGVGAGWTLPVEVAPHRSITLPLPTDTFEHLQRVTAHLATGEQFRSNRLSRKASRRAEAGERTRTHAAGAARK